VPVLGRTPITVAIPTMNGARHLAETLSGVLRQEGVPFDLMVSDDRSDDETLALVRERAGDRVRVVINSERLGLARNWNQCVALSRTPLVAVVHQDDVLRPGHLAAHVGAFEGDPGVGLVASASGVIDAAGSPVPETVVGRGGLGPVDQTFLPGEALARLAAGNPLRCSAVTLRAEAHAEAGGFDPSLRYVVDWDFWARVASRWSLAWRAAATVDVRWHPASETHRFKTGTADLEESERVLDALLARLRGLSPPAAAAAGRVAHRRLGLAYLNRAYDGLKAGDGWLARHCLRKALRTDPRVVVTIAADPRLAVLMAAAWAAPGLSGRWFGGPGGPNRACSTA
jgi:glycosyltransferase involved in cell wall biosynthesis